LANWVLMPYFMISAPRLSAGAIWRLPPGRRRSVEDLLPKIVPVLRRYLIGICVVVFYTPVVAWIGFGPVFHLPNAVLLALTVGVLELIPVIGPFASATIVGLVAIQQKASGQRASCSDSPSRCACRSTTSSDRSCSAKRRGFTRSL
jgi:predicted PurR-regulated permease PerM